MARIPHAIVALLALAGCGAAAATPLAQPHQQPHASLAAAHPPLEGRVIGIDPGHNGRNYTDPAYLGHQVWNGREKEDCDTTGTQTEAGYPEPRFTYQVATSLARDLRRLGATVVMTRHSNRGVGPCVNRRARIIDAANADVAVDIHADGGPSGGRGFAILEPVKDRVNRHVIASSVRFGKVIRRELLAMTAMPESTYDGHRGIAKRDDLAGLNLATQPKVLVECGNMRNPHDARMLTSKHFQHRLAAAFTAAIVSYLRR